MKRKPKPPKAILLVEPVDRPWYWPDAPAVVQLTYVPVAMRRGRSVRVIRAPIVTGYSTIVEYTKTTCVPLVLDELKRLMREWREQFEGVWRFTLQLQGYAPARLTPWTRKLVMTPSTKERS